MSSVDASIIEMHFEMSKKSRKKIPRVHPDIFCCHTKFHKKEHFLWPV
jgi:hypothetical protein